MTGTVQLDAIDLDSALLGVLIDATSAREGATAILEALAPALEDGPGASDATSLAIAARDRNGTSLHVLAEHGAPRIWPAALEPRFALSAQAGIDSQTDVLVVPLRANGRVIGAILVAGSTHAGAPLRDPSAARLLDSVASVLQALIVRADAASQRRADALRSIESVIDGLAHQIANPMTGASAIAQILAEEIPDEGQRAAVKQIRQELNRAFAVLKDLQAFQRDNGSLAGVLDLNSIAEAVACFRGYAIREQGITLDVRTLTSTAPVRVDARELEQALLLSLRFAELQSRGSVNRSLDICVVERPGGELGVEITDSGPGNVPEIATSFYDLPFDVDRNCRAGVNDTPDLGLVDSILRGAGGRLEVRGSKAAGTTLSLVLPRASTGSNPIQSRSR